MTNLGRGPSGPPDQEDRYDAIGCPFLFGKNEKIPFLTMEEAKARSVLAQSLVLTALTEPEQSLEVFNSFRNVLAFAVHEGSFWFDQLNKTFYGDAALPPGEE